VKQFEVQWLTYQAEVIPQNASAIQIKESRRAFYAGAQALLGLQMTFSQGDAEPTEQDLAMMDAIAGELKQFNEDVKKGVA